MSDRDSFIDEVSEEVRRDRYYDLWRRYGVVVIGAVIAVVIAAAGKTWYDAQSIKTAQAVGGAVIAAGDAPPSEAAEALSALADQTDHDGAATLARLRAAAAFAEAGDAEAAASAYDTVAADGSVSPLLQDFAALRAVLLRADAMGPDALIGALEPIAGGGGPFRLLALEAQALAHYELGDEGAAAAALTEIIEDAAVPQGLRQRVLSVMAAIGVEPPAPEIEADGDAEG